MQVSYVNEGDNVVVTLDGRRIYSGPAEGCEQALHAQLGHDPHALAECNRQILNELTGIEEPVVDLDLKRIQARKIRIAFGTCDKDNKPKNLDLTLGKLVQILHEKIREGEKDGTYLLQGSTAGERNAESMEALYLCTGDIENGDDEKHIEQQIRKSGLLAVLWHTHSHLKTTSHISERDFAAHQKRLEGKSDRDVARDYFLSKKGWRPWLADSLSGVTHRRDANGRPTFEVTHAPMPRLRVALFLDKPFEFMGGGKKQFQGVAEWKAKYLAVWERIGLVVDTACNDPARLMYLPSHAKGAPRPRVWAIKGKLLELPGEIAEPHAETLAVARLEVPQMWGPQTRGLKRLLHEHSRDFDAVAFFTETQRPRGNNDDANKAHVGCPFEDNHTGGVDDTKTDFVVWNANERTGWDCRCQHQGCQINGKNDRGQFLDAECQRRGITDAEELLPWCADSSTGKNDLVVSGAEPCAIPPGSETDLSHYIAGKHGTKLRYVAKWGQWLMFDGQRWRKDDTLAMWEMVKREVADYATRTFAGKPLAQRKLASKQSIAAVESLTRSDRGVAATFDQWDRDPMLLNTPGGVVDLRTGSIRPAEATDYLTKAAAVAPGGECPQWRAFLDQITAGDRELQTYLQRVFGYALTGSTKEHAMFFGYGTGGNGKGTLLNTLIGILADYALHAPIEVFTATKYDRHSTELARLHGARLVISTETEKGRQWAEARIKAVTGGDPITARYMRHDDFTYTPQFKLFITGNHMPTLSGVDEAMRRRINIVPFTVTIPKNKRDTDFAERLRSEWGGILAWGIQGCLDWQRGGLRPPRIVLEATERYFSEQDPIEAWIAEQCSLDDAEAWTGTVALHGSYEKHCQEAGEIPADQKEFVRRLEGRGLVRREQRVPTRQAGFLGIKLR